MDDNQFKQLMEHMDDGFGRLDSLEGRIEDGFTDVYKTFDEHDATFQKMFRYIMDMDKRIGDEFSEMRNDIRELTSRPDLFLKRLDDNETEQAARDAQWNRLIEWAREVSKKTGVPLPDL